jgi:hypothetical protein
MKPFHLPISFDLLAAPVDFYREKWRNIKERMIVRGVKYKD